MCIYVYYTYVGGNSKLVILINISPIKSSQGETETSLEFGNIAFSTNLVNITNI